MLKSITTTSGVSSFAIVIVERPYAGLADNFHVMLLLQSLTEPMTHQDMIIGQHDSNAHSSTPFFSNVFPWAQSSGIGRRCLRQVTDTLPRCECAG